MHADAGGQSRPEVGSTYKTGSVSAGSASQCFVQRRRRTEWPGQGYEACVWDPGVAPGLGLLLERLESRSKPRRHGQMLNGTRVLANGRANGDRRDEGDEEGLAPRYASIIHFTSASVQAWASRKKQAGNPARRNEHVCCKLVPPAASTWMGQAVR